MKFDDAFCLNTDSNVLVDTVSDVYQNDMITYVQLYQGQLFCPECRVAELVFVRETPSAKAHFRTLQGAVHKDCSLSQPTLKSRDSTSLITKPKDVDRVRAQVGRTLMSLLSSNDRQQRLKNPPHNLLQTPVTPTKQAKSVQNNYRLHRKRLERDFSDDDLEKGLLIYGVADVVWEVPEAVNDDAQEDRNFKLLIYAHSQRKLRYKLIVTERVYQKLPQKIKFDLGVRIKCAVAFAVVFENKFNERKSYRQAVLRRSDFLDIVPFPLK